MEMKVEPKTEPVPTYGFSLCRQCGSAVDTKDTFSDRCPECGTAADWNDEPQALAKWLEWKEANRREE